MLHRPANGGDSPRAVPTTVWLVMTASIPVYVGAMYILFGSTLLEPFPSSEPLIMVFGALGLAFAVVPSRVVCEVLDRYHAESASRARHGEAVGVDREPSSRPEALGPDGRRTPTVADASSAAFFVRLALNESIALFGVVLAFQLQQFWPVVPFAAAALVLNLLAAPRSDAGDSTSRLQSN